ncbi:MAG: hypothetical protein CMM99_04930 [Rickettsiales bacterium]|nr:hypothetical protein [Rickettsiales bacterium]|tara:strand:- start:2148 stop:2474 length:327 start_codon:yes stop_codon:yes gene_type:complete
MVITPLEISNNSKKFNLNNKNFLFIKKKNFLKIKYFIIYKPFDFYFEIDKNKKDLNNFFPYFSRHKGYSNIETWFSSIKETMIKSNKIVKDLKESKSLRDNFKKEYQV